MDLLTEALDGFRSAGDVEGEAESATVAARYSWYAGDRFATDRYIAVALKAVADRPASRARAEALTNQSGFLMLAARYDESIRVGSEALPLVEALGMEVQRARLHIVIGTARWGLGDTHGLKEIEAGISIAEAAGDFDMVGIGYDNLCSGLHSYGRLAEARRVWRQRVQISERYGLASLLRFAREEGAAWDHVDGRWDEAIAVADELITAADGGDPHYTDPLVLSLRAWIRLARRDSGRGRSRQRSIRAAVARGSGSRDEANELASELAAIGSKMVGR